MINTYTPYLGKEEKKHLLNCIDSTFVSTAGPNIQRFENLFCKIYKFKHSVAVNSGTSALHIALLSSGVCRNDLVIVPSYTFAATANAITYCGGSPWFFDCDKNLFLDLKKIEKTFKKKTKFKNGNLIHKSSGQIVRAIVPVQTLGMKINFDDYEKFAKKYNLKLIFDSAACHDPRIFDFKKSNKSIFCFSFNGNKTITTGSGGILATNSKKKMNLASLYSTVGKKKSNYDYEVVGFNYKMTSLQASLGLSQLKNLDKIFKKKKLIFSYYQKKLKIKIDHRLLIEKASTNWVFAILLNKSNIFKKIKKKFNFHKIQIEYFWKPLHNQKPYKKFLKEDLRHSDNVWKNIILLPSHPNITKNNQDKICNILNKIL